MRDVARGSPLGIPIRTESSRSRFGDSLRTPIEKTPSYFPRSMDKSLSDLLECPVCLEPFSARWRRTPATAGCGHTFCMEHELGNRCPICRAHFGKLQRNIVLCKIIDRLPPQPASRVPWSRRIRHRWAQLCKKWFPPKPPRPTPTLQIAVPERSSPPRRGTNIDGLYFIRRSDRAPAVSLSEAETGSVPSPIAARNAILVAQQQATADRYHHGWSTEVRPNHRKFCGHFCRRDGESCCQDEDRRSVDLPRRYESYCSICYDRCRADDQ